MPRLPPLLISHAKRLNRYLPLLLRECRDLNFAQNELRWMQETILEKKLGITAEWEADHTTIWRPGSQADRILQSWVRRRTRAEPLQYILGTQPFGELEIKCKRSALIPRPETEIYTTELASILHKLRNDDDKTRHLETSRDGEERTLTIADFCTGTGCIALLLHSLLQSPTPDRQSSLFNLRIRAFDISSEALRLSEQNLEHNLNLGTLHGSARSSISFESLDVLALSRLSQPEIRAELSSENNGLFDVIISNPPYISPSDYCHGPTTKSVRMYEPKIALVPPADLTYRGINQADQFYLALIRIAAAAKCKLLIMEIGDTAQAIRVLELCKSNIKDNSTGSSKLRHLPVVLEVWKDDGKVVRYPQNGNIGSFHEPDGIPCRAVVMWVDQEWAQARTRQDH